MNEWIVTKKICVLEEEKDIELIFQWDVTKQDYFVPDGLEFKTTINGSANPMFLMPELKICKRHVKTHNTYLKPLPQNYYLHLWLLSALLPRDTMRTPCPTSISCSASRQDNLWVWFFTCRSWDRKSCMAVLETWLQQDRGKVGAVVAALCPVPLPTSLLPLLIERGLPLPFDSQLLGIIQCPACQHCLSLAFPLAGGGGGWVGRRGRHLGQKN